MDGEVGNGGLERERESGRCGVADLFRAWGRPSLTA